MNISFNFNHTVNFLTFSQDKNIPSPPQSKPILFHPIISPHHLHTPFHPFPYLHSIPLHSTFSHHLIPSHPTPSHHLIPSHPHPPFPPSSHPSQCVVSAAASPTASWRTRWTESHFSSSTDRHIFWQQCSLEERNGKWKRQKRSSKFLWLLIWDMVIALMS